MENYFRMPVIFESGKHGEQGYDIMSWLSHRHQTIFIDGPITEETGNHVAAQLVAMNKTAKSEVNFIINSPGGSVYAMNTILDAMDMVKDQMTLRTKCIGIAMSAAAIILTNGTKGHRTASRRSNIMFHDVSSGNAGTYRDIERSFDHLKTLREGIRDTLLVNTNLTSDNVDSYMDRDEYIDVYKSIDIGAIDHISEGFNDE